MSPESDCCCERRTNKCWLRFWIVDSQFKFYEPNEVEWNGRRHQTIWPLAHSNRKMVQWWWLHRLHQHAYLVFRNSNWWIEYDFTVENASTLEWLSRVLHMRQMSRESPKLGRFFGQPIGNTDSIMHLLDGDAPIFIHNAHYKLNCIGKISSKHLILSLLWNIYYSIEYHFMAISFFKMLSHDKWMTYESSSVLI